MEVRPSIDDSARLAMIDHGPHDGPSTTLRDDVAGRLADWCSRKAMDQALKNTPWEHGPKQVALPAPFTLRVPSGYNYLNQAAAQALGQALGKSHPIQGALRMSEDESLLVNLFTKPTGHDDASAFNPGHGITPQVNPAHVKVWVDEVHAYGRR